MVTLKDSRLEPKLVAHSAVRISGEMAVLQDVGGGMLRLKGSRKEQAGTELTFKS